MARPIPGNFSVRTRTVLLLPLRVFVGVVFLLQVYEHWDQGWLSGEGFREALQPFLSSSHLPLLRELIRAHVLEWSSAAGPMIMLLEGIIGVLLIVGLMVRLSSLLGMLLTGLWFVLFGFSTVMEPARQAEGAWLRSLQINSPALSLYGLLFLVVLVFLLTGAGRSFGLDGFIWRWQARRAVKAIKDEFEDLEEYEPDEEDYYDYDDEDEDSYYERLVREEDEEDVDEENEENEGKE